MQTLMLVTSLPSHPTRSRHARILLLQTTVGGWRNAAMALPADGRHRPCRPCDIAAVQFASKWSRSGFLVIDSDHHYDSTITGVGTHQKVGRLEARKRGRKGVWFWGGGRQPPTHQLGDLGECCKLPPWGPGRSPGQKWIWCILRR